MTTKKTFGKITPEENMTSVEEGNKIFNSLRERFDSNPDLIMNTLSVAFVNLIVNYVGKDDRPILIQVIHKILTDNTK